MSVGTSSRECCEWLRAPLGSLTVAQGWCPETRDVVDQRWLLGCFGVMVLLLGGDGDLLAVGGCSGSGWWLCLRWMVVKISMLVVARISLLVVVRVSLLVMVSLLGGDGRLDVPSEGVTDVCSAVHEAQEAGSSYFCTEQGADSNEQLINITGLDGCGVSVPN